MKVRWIVRCEVSLFNKYELLKKSASYRDDSEFLGHLLELETEYQTRNLKPKQVDPISTPNLTLTEVEDGKSTGGVLRGAKENAKRIGRGPPLFASRTERSESTKGGKNRQPISDTRPASHSSYKSIEFPSHANDEMALCDGITCEPTLDLEYDLSTSPDITTVQDYGKIERSPGGKISSVLVCKRPLGAEVESDHQPKKRSQIGRILTQPLPKAELYMCRACATLCTSRPQLRLHFKRGCPSSDKSYLVLNECGHCKCTVFSDQFDTHVSVCNKMVQGSYLCSVEKLYICDRCSLSVDGVEDLCAHVLLCIGNRGNSDLDLECAVEPKVEVDDFEVLNEVVDIEPVGERMDLLGLQADDYLTSSVEIYEHFENQDSIHCSKNKSQSMFRIWYGCPICPTVSKKRAERLFIEHLATHEKNFFNSSICLFCSAKVTAHKAEHIIGNHVPSVWLCRICRFSAATTDPPIHDCQTETRPVIGEKFMAFVKDRSNIKTHFECRLCFYRTDVYDDGIEDAYCSNGLITHLVRHENVAALTMDGDHDYHISANIAASQREGLQLSGNSVKSDLKTAGVNQIKTVSYSCILLLWHCPLCPHTSEEPHLLAVHLNTHLVIMANSWCDFCAEFCTESMHEHMTNRHVCTLYRCSNCLWFSNVSKEHNCYDFCFISTVKNYFIAFKKTVDQRDMLGFQCNYCLKSFYLQLIYCMKSFTMYFNPTLATAMREHLVNDHGNLNSWTPLDELKLHNVACVMCKKIVMDSKEFAYHMGVHKKMALLQVEANIAKKQSQTVIDCNNKVKPVRAPVNPTALLQKQPKIILPSERYSRVTKSDPTPRLILMKETPTSKKIVIRNRNHMKSNNTNYWLDNFITTWQCPLCPMKESDVNLMKLHIATHKSLYTEKYCVFCTEFVGDMSLHRHLLISHSIKTIHCKKCCFLSLKSKTHVCGNKPCYNLENFVFFYMSVGSRVVVRCKCCSFKLETKLLVDKYNEAQFQHNLRNMQAHFNRFHSAAAVVKTVVETLLDDVSTVQNTSTVETSRGGSSLENTGLSIAPTTEVMTVSNEEIRDSSDLCDEDSECSNATDGFEYLFCCPLCLVVSETLQLVTDHFYREHAKDEIATDGICNVCNLNCNDAIFEHALNHIPKVWLCNLCYWFAAVRIKPSHDCGTEVRPCVGEGFHAYRVSGMFLRYRCKTCSFETNSFDLKNGTQPTIIHHLDSHKIQVAERYS